MAFTGKATYDPGAPPGEEIAEDVSPVIRMISRAKTPLLEILSPSDEPAWSTHHEWLDDALLPDRTNAAASATSAATTLTVTTGDGQYFRAGDLLRASLISATAASSYVRDEVIYVVSVSTDTLTVTRGYGGTTAAGITNGDELQRIGRSELEGADSPSAVSNNMNRRSNYTQIFTEPVNISGSLQAARILGGVGVDGTQNREVTKRLAEIMADLERAVIASVAPAATVQGSSTVRRTMDGIIAQITSGVVDGSSYSSGITEAGLNLAFRTAWDNGAENIDLLIVGGYQKRAINSFIGTNNRFWRPEDMTFKDMVGVYESDYGPAKILLSRFVPRDMVIGLDTSRFKVLPYSNRSFYNKKLGDTGDSLKTQIIGEYTNELRNGPDGAHFVISDIPFTT
jgi:hypothetical protein